MQLNELQQLVCQQLEDLKIKDIAVIDVSQQTTVTDRLIIGTATSSRHAQSSADKLMRSIKAKQLRPLGHEGETPSDWVLIDFNDIVVHIMTEKARAFYDLEKLWDIEDLREQGAQD